MTASLFQPKISLKTIDDAQSEMETLVRTDSTTISAEKSSRTPGLNRLSRNSGTV